MSRYRLTLRCEQVDWRAAYVDADSAQDAVRLLESTLSTRDLTQDEFGFTEYVDVDVTNVEPIRESALILPFPERRNA